MRELQYSSKSHFVEEKSLLFCKNNCDVKCILRCRILREKRRTCVVCYYLYTSPTWQRAKVIIKKANLADPPFVMSQSAPPSYWRAANRGLVRDVRIKKGSDSSKINTGLFNPSIRLRLGLFKRRTWKMFSVSAWMKKQKCHSRLELKTEKANSVSSIF